MLPIDKIMSADILDIIFEGKNKLYGAYDLRKKYPKHLGRALMITTLLFGLIFGGIQLQKALTGRQEVQELGDVELEDIVLPPPPDDVPPPPPPPPTPPPPKATIRFVPPVIKKDNEVKEEEPPPTEDELEKAKVSTETKAGAEGKTFEDPPPKYVAPEPTAQPVVVEAKIFDRVEVMPQFPGGQTELLKYFANNIKYPSIAKENNITGKVVLQFVINPDGSTSDVRVVRGIGGGCDEEAVRVANSMPNWIPGQQNGQKVKVKYTIPVSFKLLGE
jgi:periplasmic protein TonB